MQMKFNKILAIFLILSSAFILGITFLVGFTVNAVTGLILLSVGIAMLIQPALIISKDKVELRNLLGMTMKTFPYSPGNLTLRDNALYIENKKVSSLWWTNADRVSLIEYIEGSHAK
jgi:membrane-bound ClpP family serine protease